MSGYGDAGPYRDRKAYDMLVQAEAGLISVTGTPDEMSKTGIPTSDIAAGMYALTSVLSALFRRATTGVGARVSVAMFDATVEWMGHPMYMRLYGGRQIARAGLGHAAIVPYDKYPTADGDILIGVQNDRGWDTLTRVALERPDLADDPRYRTNIERVARRAEVDAAIGAETKRFTTDELDRRLADAGIPAAEIRDLEGVVAHPQLSERDRWREVDTEVGPVRALLPPLTFDDVELAMGPVPALGQHTEAVLREFGIGVPPTPSA